MKRFALAVVPAVLLTGLLTAGPAAADRPDPAARLKSPGAARALSAQTVGNGVLEVFVAGIGLATGSITVRTGPQHPAGPGHDVLFGNGSPGTSYSIIRRIDRPDVGEPETITDYVQGQLITHDTEVSLDNSSLGTTPLGTNGLRSEWELGVARLVQDVIVRGSTPADTVVDVVTTINKREGEAANDVFQVQHLWDVAVGADDGPVVQDGAAFQPFGPLGTTERMATSANLVVADNDRNQLPPTFATGVRAVSPADAIRFVCWPQAVFAEFGGYEIDPALDVSTAAADCTNSAGDPDSAVQLLFTPSDAAVVSTTAQLVAAPGTPRPTTVVASAVSLFEPAFTATLSDTGAGARIAGRPLSFTVSGAVRCTAVTNAQGVASCGSTLDGLAATLAGYTARFPGTAVWAAATGSPGRRAQ